jgi:nitrogenase subunit NifH
VIFVASKIADADERRRVERLLGESVGLEIPLDPAVRDAERRLAAVIDAAPDSPVVRAVQGLADIIEERGMESS